jgi:hypothetical protein
VGTSAWLETQANKRFWFFFQPAGLEDSLVFACSSQGKNSLLEITVGRNPV